MKSRFLASIFAIFVATSLGAACSGDTPGKIEGDGKGDSADNTCATHADCRDGMSCSGGWCMISNFGSPCGTDRNCTVGYCDPAGFTCVACRTSDDCPIGFSCTVNHECSSGPVGGDNDSPGGDNDSPGGDNYNPTGKTELELCTNDIDCAGSLACRAMTKLGSPRRCTRACTGDGDCPSGLRCYNDGVSNVCLYDDTGKPCAQATDCYNACAQGPGYCTRGCTVGADCPNGYGCMEVAAQRVCVKVEAACDGGTNPDCIVQAACDTESPTMIIWGCTLACFTASDCPQRAQGLPSWTCDVGGICRRPGDIWGPLHGGYLPSEWHCDFSAQPVNLCNDGQHMDFSNNSIPAPPAVDCGSAVTFPGVGNDACVNSCRYQGGCPYGFSCTAVGSVGGGRIGLCIPSGMGEVGAPCSVHIECAFGYCANNVCSRDCTDDDICPGNSTCVPGSPPAVEGQTFMRCE